MGTAGGQDPEGPPEGPPEDPEDWDDDQWIAWLRSTDEGGDPPSRQEPRRTPAPRGGQVLGQAMLGMARAIYGQEEDDVAIVAEGPAEPDDEARFRVRLDPDHPERSTVVFPDEPEAPAREEEPPGEEGAAR